MGIWRDGRKNILVNGPSFRDQDFRVFVSLRKVSEDQAPGPGVSGQSARLKGRQMSALPGKVRLGGKKRRFADEEIRSQGQRPGSVAGRSVHHERERLA